MEKLTASIVRHKKSIITVFVLAVIVCGFLMTTVQMNLDNTKYLPDDINSKQAAKLLEEEFAIGGTASLMIKGDGVAEFKSIKERLQSIDGIDNVLWMDDMTDVYVPEFAISDQYRDSFQKDGYALFRIFFSEGNDSLNTYAAIDEIENLSAEEIYLAGPAVSSRSFLQRTMSELPIYMIVAVILILIILLLSTESWIEPVMFLGTIGVAIVINLGTNVFFTDGISNMTMSAAAVLQLAVSMDYAIFLLHRFHDERKRELDVGKAMSSAVKKSFPVIAGSALTTAAGFMALLSMDFGIGREMGAVLAKGVLISFATVIFLLPAVVTAMDGPIEKTKHRSFLLGFKKFSAFAVKTRWISISIVVVLAALSFFAGNKVDFYYADNKALPDNDVAVTGYRKISEVFNGHAPGVIIVPVDDALKQITLERELEEIDGVDDVAGLYSETGAQMSDILIPDNIKEYYMSENFARMDISIKVDEADSPEAFLIVEQIRGVLSKNYDEWYAAGEIFSYYDLDDITAGDNTRSGIIAMILVFLVVAVVFRSLGIPLMAVLLIEAAVYINLAINYFAGTPTSFLTMIVISAVQLGATIDYAVLYISKYEEIRKEGVAPMAAAKDALSDVFPSILTSAGILMAATFSIYFISTVSTAAELCLMIGRGALISMLVVSLVLPGLMAVTDKFLTLSSIRRLPKKKGKKE